MPYSTADFKLMSRNRSARNSLPLEVLGTYDPIPKLPPDGEGKKFKDIRLDSVRAKYWLGVGAQPTKTTWRLLSMVSFVLWTVLSFWIVAFGGNSDGGSIYCR